MGSGYNRVLAHTPVAAPTSRRWQMEMTVAGRDMSSSCTFASVPGSTEAVASSATYTLHGTNERTLSENDCRYSSTRGAPFAERTWQCVASPSPDKVTGARQLKSSCHLPQPGRLVSAHNGVNNTNTKSPQDRRQPWHIPADTLPQWHRGRHCVVHPTAAGRQR